MLSVRLTPEDERLIKRYAEFNDMTVSEFVRKATMERIEEEYDLEILKEYEDRRANGALKTYSHEEVLNELFG